MSGARNTPFRSTGLQKPASQVARSLLVEGLRSLASFELISLCNVCQLQSAAWGGQLTYHRFGKKYCYWFWSRDSLVVVRFGSRSWVSGEMGVERQNLEGSFYFLGELNKS